MHFKDRCALAFSRVALIALLLVGPFSAQAQAEAEFDTVVERYVAEGLRSNLGLQDETLEVEKAAQALAAARARFFPELSLQARYTRADGGREFNIPIGTALNPVYSTLNDLLAAQGQPAQFPQISDERSSSCAEKSRTRAWFSASRCTHPPFLRQCAPNAHCSTPAVSVAWRSPVHCAATSRLRIWIG